MFRPDANAKDAAAYVRRLLHRLRAQYPDLNSLAEHAGMLQWTGGSDVADFRAAVEARNVDAAVALHAQDFLALTPRTGMALFDQWVADKRARLRGDLDHLLMQAISLAPAGAADRRAMWMRYLGTSTLLNESVVQFLLEHACTPPEAAAATLAFEKLQHQMATLHGLRPNDTTRTLYRALVESGQGGLQSDQMVAYKPPTAVGAIPHADADPAAKGQKVVGDGTADQGSATGAEAWGRELELARLDASLDNPAQRLVSIVGVGGMGKTWLARALYTRRLSRGGEDAKWVDLIAVRSRNEMLVSIAHAVGFVPRQGSLESQLLHWFKAHGTLVFLDNFEQLLEHRDLLRAFLDNTPHLRFVVTSRRPLFIAAEQVFRLEGLDWHGTSAPAFLLFRHHAARAGSSVPDNSEAIQALLAHLEGMPLAIEMAAAWMPLLTPAEILRQLRHDPSVIDSARASDTEGRGIAAVLRTTWEQLSHDEQQAMVALAIVRGPVEWSTIEVLVQPNATALLQLASTLVVRRDCADRLGLHPLFREFVEKHADAAMLAQHRERHAQHFIRKLSGLTSQPSSAFDFDHLRSRTHQLTDFIEAWRHCVEHGDYEAAARTFANLSRLLVLACRFEEAIELCRYADGVFGQGHPLAGEVACLHALSAFRAGRMEEAAEVAGAAVAGTFDDSTMAQLHSCLAGVYWFWGRYTEALEHGTLANGYLPGSDAATTVQVREQLALCNYAIGDLPKATLYLQANLSAAVLHRAQQLEGRTLCMMGTVATADDRGSDALPLFQRALAIFKSVQDFYEIGYCLRAKSYAHYRNGHFTAQMECASEALATFERAGYYHETGETLFAITTALHARGDSSGAKTLCEKALAHCHTAGNVPAAMRCIGALGIFTMQPRAEDAENRHNQTVAQRIQGLSCVLFAVMHPSCRKSDRLIYERQLALLEVTETERARAAKIASQRTYESTCAELLGPTQGQMPPRT